MIPTYHAFNNITFFRQNLLEINKNPNISSQIDSFQAYP